MTTTLALYCAAIVVASLLGGGLPLATVLTHTRLQLYLSFAAGAMLGAVFFHMLPEAVEAHGHRVLSWAALGLLVLFFLERFLAFHQHEPAVHLPHQGSIAIENAPVADHHHGSSPLQWSAAAVGLALHTLIGGFALASAASVAPGSGPSRAGWGVFLATLVHKPADSLTLVSLMIRAGVSRSTALAANLAFSLLIPLGAIAFVVSDAWLGETVSSPYTAAVLAFSAGTFLCIALSDILPELQFHHHDRIKLSLALLAGFGIMALSLAHA
jgi:zinc and cadmium transporter